MLWHLLAILAVAWMMCGPAIWNEYPLIYFDSEDYVEMSFTWQPIVWRIMTYAVFCTLAKPFGTLWTLVILQALMTSWLLHEGIYAFTLRQRLRVFLGLGAALALLSGLPVVVSEVLADVFAGLAVLGIATMAFGTALPAFRRGLLVLPTAVAIGVHMSHVAVAAGLMIVLVALFGGSFLLRRLPRPRLLAPFLAFAIGAVSVPLTHWLATGEAYFAKSGRVLQLALFVQDGLAKKYLDEVCPQGAALKMCAYKDALPETADEFLWGDSPFDELGGWTAMHDEADVIVEGAIRLFPWNAAAAAVANTWTQINLVADGEDLVPMTWHFVKTEMTRYPADFRHFHYARQQRRDGIDFEPVNRIHVPLAQAAEFAMLGFGVLAWRRRSRSGVGLILVVALSLFGNAVVCGALSNPHDRYQSRMVWLALFASVVVAIRLDQRAHPTPRGWADFPDPLGRLKPMTAPTTSDEPV